MGMTVMVQACAAADCALVASLTASLHPDSSLGFRHLGICQGRWHPRLEVLGSLVHSQGPVMVPGLLPGRSEKKGVRLREKR